MGNDENELLDVCKEAYHADVLSDVENCTAFPKKEVGEGVRNYDCKEACACLIKAEPN